MFRATRTATATLRQLHTTACTCAKRELSPEDEARIRAFNDGTYAQPLAFDQQPAAMGRAADGAAFDQQPAAMGRAADGAADGTGSVGDGDAAADGEAEAIAAIPELPAPDEVVRISGYSARGFTVSGTKVAGGVLVLPSLALLWDVASADELTLDALILPRILHPRMDLLLIGTGKSIVRLPDHLLDPLRARGIAVEAMDSINAAATFNFLAEEGRAVGAALMPVSAFSARADQERGAM
ncbi:NADH dehydrogenase 1 alpha subcomplex assembly factor 3 [Thecamonas trahens ATCC 50062]|uniref:NADH dehydrogenase [ubiquinone] 1 alpha subcomplex assembly factor 3 n=1 Tax=Thecamonas trahens ATCC 50062 TaxID=461836 RepID=A0A0L0DPS3_THETB|nr:NADH dehydrogenase 1 alpha subcomplex assembly factor 3 [Thecamonas trahens ATCC 50062]KNC54255.1 NADH dehydrogenase 1 alpha subcomplex assembly factor 3 [Thecamonas trahens ATCC 50062]|eukprot:XP_013753890.1 NADH dehydrogenase 1 alpha subcomplex assembly factor 3 [Thecamonas trahens ATCC 50062]